MTPFLVDSHCHLDYEDFAQDGIDAVVARAQAAGVGHMMTICTEIAKFPRVLAVAAQFDCMSCTVGTHPHHAADAGEMDITAEDIIPLTHHPKVAGIGETGLDYYYNNAPAEEQKRVFANHIRAAVETGLPLIVHTRDADDDTIHVLRDAGQGRATGVIHCFSGGVNLARAALELGFYISFSGIITFKKAEELREVVKFVPLDRILVETDSPYLAPVPFRGKRNEPAFVAHTAQTVAALKNLTDEDIARETTRNYFTLFSKAQPAETQS